MVANKLALAVIRLIILLAIAFYTIYRETKTVTVGATDIYLCFHNPKYIILLRLSPFFIASAYFLIHHLIFLYLIIYFINFLRLTHQVQR